MSSQEAREVVRRFIDSAWNGINPEQAGTLLHPDLVDHNPLPIAGRPEGAAGLLAVVEMIRTGIPDLRRTIEDEIVEGDKVVTRFTDHGWHRGDLLGIPPTGREVTVQGINIQVVRDGRIVEIWHLEDMAGLMRQLGVAA